MPIPSSYPVQGTFVGYSSVKGLSSKPTLDDQSIERIEFEPKTKTKTIVYHIAKLPMNLDVEKTFFMGGERSIDRIEFEPKTKTIVYHIAKLPLNLDVEKTFLWGKNID